MNRRKAAFYIFFGVLFLGTKIDNVVVFGDAAAVLITIGAIELIDSFLGPP